MHTTLFQQTFDSSDIAVARTDAAGHFIEVNSAYEQLIGYTLAELKYISYHELTPEKWLVFENQKVIKEAFCKGDVGYEKEYIHKSGEVIAIKAHIYRISGENGIEPGMWGTFQAIEQLTTK